MIAAIVAALMRLLYEIVKAESGPVLAIAAPVVPAALLDRWAEFMRDRGARGVH